MKMVDIGLSVAGTGRAGGQEEGDREDKNDPGESAAGVRALLMVFARLVIGL